MYVPIRMSTQSVLNRIAEKVKYRGWSTHFVAARNLKTNMTLEIEVEEPTSEDSRNINIYVVKESPLITMYRESAKIAGTPLMYDCEGTVGFTFTIGSHDDFNDWLKHSGICDCIDMVYRWNFSIA